MIEYSHRKIFVLYFLDNPVNDREKLNLLNEYGSFYDW